MSIRKYFCSRLVAIAIGFSLCAETYAQHYPAGSEGLKAASMPPPGLQVIEQNTFYFSDKTPGYNNQLESTPFRDTFKLFTYTETLRIIWMSEFKVFGADFGISARIPFIYKNHNQRYYDQIQRIWGNQFGPVIASVNKFGVGDIEIQPAILSWHRQQWDWVAGYSFWAPTGEYSHKLLSSENLGSGDWSHMFTLGATWYPDQKKSWAISLLTHYEINMPQYNGLYNANPYPNIALLDTSLGDIFTLEWGISKSVFENLDVGLTGYYQQQVTPTDGPTWYGPTFLDERVEVAGVGPEINFTYPKWKLNFSVRYAYEFSALDHPQGQNINLTIRKNF